MSRLAFWSVLAAAACHSKAAPPAQPANTSPAAAPAAPTAPVDCGTVDTTMDVDPPNARTAYQCFADAFAASRDATVRWFAVTDEGGTIYTTYRVVPSEAGAPLLTITTDDRDDGFAANPGIHELICTSLRIEPTTSNSVVLYPEGCSGAL
jgi:hypothetical protein